MLFVKGGYSRLRYDVTLPASLAGTDISDALKASLGEFKKGVFKLGAGYERKLTDTFSVRAGVDYVKHKDIHKQLEAKVALIVSF